MGAGGGAEGWYPDQLKSQVSRSVQTFIWKGGGNSNPKCQDLFKFSFVCVCVGGGEGEAGVMVQTNIPEILECGHSRNFTPKIVEA